MRKIYQLDGRRIDLNSPATVGDVTYPHLRDNWQELGVVLTEVEDYPDPLWYTWSENLDGTLNVKPKSLAECKEFRYKQIAAERYRREVSGVVLNGALIATDRESQSKVASATLAAMRNPTILINWKADNGFVVVDAGTIGAIADAVIAHVQAAYTWESTQVALVAAMTTVAQVIAYEVPILTIPEK